MLKIVVYDSGYGGEYFADQLEKALPIVEIIRVIDWRHADKILSSPKQARNIARTTLRPYIGKVDLIIFANHLLSATSAKFFQRKYKNQRFLALKPSQLRRFNSGETLILTTKAFARTINYYNYLFHLKGKSKTLVLDDWVDKIDNGELDRAEIRRTFTIFTEKENWHPKEIILTCTQFSDIKKEIRLAFGKHAKVYDSNDDAIRNVCKILRIRGALRKRK